MPIDTRDFRSDARREAAEAALALPDPTAAAEASPEPEDTSEPKAAAPALQLEQCHPHLQNVIARTERWVANLFTRARHDIPTAAARDLVPMLVACRLGHTSDAWDRSAGWPGYFGSTKAEQVQNALRSVYQVVRDMKVSPAFDAPLAHLMAGRMASIINEARTAQIEARERAKAAANPAAQSAAQLLEVLPDFLRATESYGAANRSVTGIVAELKDGAARLERIAKVELAA